eukprot:scaffold3.g6607.t1
MDEVLALLRGLQAGQDELRTSLAQIPQLHRELVALKAHVGRLARPPDADAAGAAAVQHTAAGLPPADIAGDAADEAAGHGSLHQVEHRRDGRRVITPQRVRPQQQEEEQEHGTRLGQPNHKGGEARALKAEQEEAVEQEAADFWTAFADDSPADGRERFEVVRLPRRAPLPYRRRLPCGLWERAGLGLLAAADAALQEQQQAAAQERAEAAARREQQEVQHGPWPAHLLATSAEACGDSMHPEDLAMLLGSDLDYCRQLQRRVKRYLLAFPQRQAAERRAWRQAAGLEDSSDEEDAGSQDGQEQWGMRQGGDYGEEQEEEDEGESGEDVEECSQGESDVEDGAAEPYALEQLEACKEGALHRIIAQLRLESHDFEEEARRALLEQCQQQGVMSANEWLSAGINRVHSRARLRTLVAVLTGLTDALEQQALRWELRELPRLEQDGWRIWREGRAPGVRREWEEEAAEKRVQLVNLLLALGAVHRDSIRCTPRSVKRAAGSLEPTLHDLLERLHCLHVTALAQQPENLAPEPRGARRHQQERQQQRSEAAGSGEGEAAGAAAGDLAMADGEQEEASTEGAADRPPSTSSQQPPAGAHEELRSMSAEEDETSDAAGASSAQERHPWNAAELTPGQTQVLVGPGAGQQPQQQQQQQEREHGGPEAGMPAQPAANEGLPDRAAEGLELEMEDAEELPAAAEEEDEAERSGAEELEDMAVETAGLSGASAGALTRSEATTTSGSKEGKGSSEAEEEEEEAEEAEREEEEGEEEEEEEEEEEGDEDVGAGALARLGALDAVEIFRHWQVQDRGGQQEYQVTSLAFLRPLPPPEHRLTYDDCRLQYLYELNVLAGGPARHQAAYVPALLVHKRRLTPGSAAGTSGTGAVARKGAEGTRAGATWARLERIADARAGGGGGSSESIDTVDCSESELAGALPPLRIILCHDRRGEGSWTFPADAYVRWQELGVPEDSMASLCHPLAYHAWRDGFAAEAIARQLEAARQQGEDDEQAVDEAWALARRSFVRRWLARVPTRPWRRARHKLRMAGLTVVKDEALLDQRPGYGFSLHRRRVTRYDSNEMAPVPVDVEDYAEVPLGAGESSQASQGASEEAADALAAVLPGRIARALKPHQWEGVCFMFQILELDQEDVPGGCVLAHTMGLGKASAGTIQTIAFLNALYSINPEARSLLVVPPNVLFNWQQEFEDWLPACQDGDAAGAPLRRHLTMEQFDVATLQGKSRGRPRRRPAVAVGDSQAPEAGGEAATEGRAALAETLTQRPHVVVVDEAHVMKNPKSQLAKALQRVATKRRLALTGYPLQNNLEELYAMVSWCDQEVLGSEKEFRRKFVEPVERGQMPGATREDRANMAETVSVLHDLTEGIVHRKGEELLKAPEHRVYEAYLEGVKALGNLQNFRDREALGELCDAPSDFRKWLDWSVEKDEAAQARAAQERARAALGRQVEAARAAQQARRQELVERQGVQARLTGKAARLTGIAQAMAQAACVVVSADCSIPRVLGLLSAAGHPPEAVQALLLRAQAVAAQQGVLTCTVLVKELWVARSSVLDKSARMAAQAAQAEHEVRAAEEAVKDAALKLASAEAALLAAPSGGATAGCQQQLQQQPSSSLPPSASASLSPSAEQAAAEEEEGGTAVEEEEEEEAGVAGDGDANGGPAGGGGGDGSKKRGKKGEGERRQPLEGALARRLVALIGEGAAAGESLDTAATPKLWAMRRLFEFCAGAAARGPDAPTEKLVVYAERHKVLEACCKLLRYDFPSLKFGFIQGNTSPSKRKQLCDRFARDDLQVMVLSQAGSHGINLVSSCRMVVLDEGWNPVYTTQAISRVWRYGQALPTFIYRLYYNGTVQASWKYNVYLRNVNKVALFKRVVDKQDLVRTKEHQDQKTVYHYQPDPGCPEQLEALRRSLRAAMEQPGGAATAARADGALAALLDANAHEAAAEGGRLHIVELEDHDRNLAEDPLARLSQEQRRAAAAKFTARTANMLTRSQSRRLRKASAAAARWHSGAAPNGPPATAQQQQLLQGASGSQQQQQQARQGSVSTGKRAREEAPPASTGQDVEQPAAAGAATDEARQAGEEAEETTPCSAKRQRRAEDPQQQHSQQRSEQGTERRLRRPSVVKREEAAALQGGDATVALCGDGSGGSSSTGHVAAAAGATAQRLNTAWILLDQDLRAGVLRYETLHRLLQEKAPLAGRSEAVLRRACTTRRRLVGEPVAEGRQVPQRSAALACV